MNKYWTVKCTFVITKIRLHHQCFRQKLGKSFLTDNLHKENFIKVISFMRLKLSHSFYLELPFDNKFKDKQNDWIRSWSRKDVLIGQFPSKSVTVFRKIGCVSIPPKSVQVHQRSLTKFLMQVYMIKGLCPLTKFLMANFDRVNGPKDYCSILTCISIMYF